MKWKIHPEAQAELANAIEHYGEIDAKTLLQFNAARRRALTLIKKWPGAATTYEDIPLDPPIKHKNLGKFPYSIYYMKVNKELAAKLEAGFVILAYAHHSRKPGYWSGRLDTLEKSVSSTPSVTANRNR